MDLLRFITAGSVDDGKSTLIGRLLFDSKAVSLDILETIEKQSKGKQNGDIDLALLTDGLRAEREQGITIDVAYKYFTTPKRKFIIADTPGHVQYTRNMVTGASNADLSIILIDARQGVVEQTRRHTFISTLLGIPNLVVCINKIDLVDYSEQRFNEIVTDFEKLKSKLKIKNLTFIPVSALNGDNVVDLSDKTPWYKGQSLLQHLEEVVVDTQLTQLDPRFQVQYVIRPQTSELHDYRGYAGRIMGGIYRKGDKITVLPSGFTSEISAIEIAQQEVEEAFAPQSVTIHLKDDIDISRGDTLVKTAQQPEVSQEIEATICWMDNKPLNEGSKFLIQQNSNTVKAIVKEIEYKYNIETLEKIHREGTASLNDIIKVRIKTAQPLAFDHYDVNRNTGGFILIDENSCSTVAAGMIG